MGTVGQLKKSVRRLLGARHIVGLTIEEAVLAAQFEAHRGNSCTLGYWPQSSDSAVQIGAHLSTAVVDIAAAGLDASISIKADKIAYDRTILRPVLDDAMAHGIRVHFDAQAYETADPTFDMIDWARTMGADVSATLPARWLRSLDDADRLLESGIPVRVVKGQSEDPTDPKRDARTAFAEVVERLAGRDAEVAVATHDRRVAEPALDLLQRFETPCYLEQLSALPRLDFLARKRSIPVRVYVAYGESGLPYALNQLLRRPAIIGWVIRDLIVRRSNRR